MSLNNSELINKSAITSGSFQGAVGLSVEEANQFVDYMKDESVLIKNCRLEPMKSATKKIDRLGIGTKILKPAVAATDSGETVGITSGQIILSAKEIIAVARISDDTLEDNIEGEAFTSHLLSLIGAQAANDLEEAAITGNARVSAVEVVDMFDGWLKRARGGHVINALEDQDRYMGLTKLSKAIKTLPNKFKARRNEMGFINSPNLAQDYVDILGGRNTGMGDAAIMGAAPLSYGKVPFVEVGLMPEDLPVSSGIETTLAADAAADATVFKVDSVDGLAAGGRLALGTQDSATYEVLTIQAVGTAGAGGTGVTTVEHSAYAHATAAAATLVDEDGTPLIFTHMKNLIMGIHRDIRIEPQRWARLRATDFVLTMRLDIQMENPDMVVLYDNLKVR